MPSDTPAGTTYVYTGKTGDEQWSDLGNWVTMGPDGWTTPTALPVSNDSVVIGGGNGQAAIIYVGGNPVASVEVGQNSDVIFLAEGNARSLYVQNLTVDANADLSLDFDGGIGVSHTTITTGGKIDVSRGMAAPESGIYPVPVVDDLGFLTIEPGGRLNIGTNEVGVQYITNLAEGAGNNFNPRAGIAGAGTFVLPMTDEPSVTNPPSVDFGTVSLGAVVTQTFTLQDMAGDGGGPAAIGAPQTDVNGANISSPELSGSGVTPQNFTMGGRGGHVVFTVTLDASQPGALSGQTIHVQYLFNTSLAGAFDVGTTIPIKADVLAPSVGATGSATGSGGSTSGTTITGNAGGSVSTGGVPCFVTGTLIPTPAGAMPVEQLRPGDPVATLAGILTVRWVGHKMIAVGDLPAAERLCAGPVLVRPDAFGTGCPFAPVTLSPDHGVLVGEVIIPVHLLIDGETVLHVGNVDRVHYVHVELERHAIIPVCGLLCESYLDTGNRGQFDAECGVRPMHDDQRQGTDGLAATLAAYRTRGAAPLCLDGPILKAVRDRLCNHRNGYGNGEHLPADIIGLVRQSDENPISIKPVAAAAAARMAPPTLPRPRAWPP